MQDDSSRGRVVRVAVEDAHPFVRAGITTALCNAGGLAVVAGVPSPAGLGEPGSSGPEFDVLVTDAHPIDTKADYGRSAAGARWCRGWRHTGRPRPIGTPR